MPRKKIWILWSTVLCITALVFVLWMIQLGTAYHDLSREARTRPGLLQEAGNDFARVFSLLEDEERGQADALQARAAQEVAQGQDGLNRALEHLLQELTATSTASTTPAPTTTEPAS